MSNVLSPTYNKHVIINNVLLAIGSTESGKEDQMDEISVVLKKFGDEQSTLLDQFERLSFEVQLNQAILGRSLSEPGTSRSSRFKAPANGQAQAAAAPPPLVKTQVKQGSRRRRGSSGFDKLLKKLLKPFLGRKVARAKDHDSAKIEGSAADPKDPKSWRALSRSLRI